MKLLLQHFMPSLSDLLAILFFTSLSILPLLYTSQNYKISGNFIDAGILFNISSKSNEIERVRREVSPNRCFEEINNPTTKVSVLVTSNNETNSVEINYTAPFGKYYMRFSGDEAYYLIREVNVTCEFLSSHEKSILKAENAKGSVIIGYDNGMNIEETYGVRSDWYSLPRYCKNKIEDLKDLLFNITSSSSCLRAGLSI